MGGDKKITFNEINPFEISNTFKNKINSLFHLNDNRFAIKFENGKNIIRNFNSFLKIYSLCMLIIIII